MEMRKKKRTRDFIRIENMNKTIDNENLDKKIEDFGRQSSLMAQNVNINLNTQKNNIYQRLKERKNR